MTETEEMMTLFSSHERLQRLSVKIFLKEEGGEKMAQMLPLREGLISLVLHHKFVLTRTWYNQSIVDARGSRMRPWQMITQFILARTALVEDMN